VYSLNYKFDSVSSAGKFSGTALDLIKRYNELAKEAQSNGNYVEMEVFRQYAEHYRKIVTEINERKNQHRDGQSDSTQNGEEIKEEVNNNLVETQAAEPVKPSEDTVSDSKTEATSETADKPRRGRRSLKVVEVSDNGAASEEVKEPRKRSYTHRRKSTKAEGAEA